MAIAAYPRWMAGRHIDYPQRQLLTVLAECLSDAMGDSGDQVAFCYSDDAQMLISSVCLAAPNGDPIFNRVMSAGGSFSAAVSKAQTVRTAEIIPDRDIVDELRQEIANGTFDESPAAPEPKEKPKPKPKKPPRSKAAPNQISMF